MQAATLVDRAARRANDLDGVRWSPDDWLDYLGQSLIWLAETHGSATARPRVVELDVGSRQELPDDVLRLLGGVCNMGADGQTPGASLHTVDIAQKDAFDERWRAASSGTPVREVVFDSRTPRTYWVSPAPDTTWHLLLNVVDIPPMPVGQEDELGVDDSYQNVLLAGMLHFAYAENTEFGSEQRASVYEQRFYRMLSVRVSGARIPREGD